MKNYGIISLMLLAALFLFNACEEEGPFIDFAEPNILLDTTFIASEIPAAQDKVILIEEYSGVQCNNCPKGAEVVKNIKEAYPNRIVSTTLHAGPFAVPYSNSTQDFLIDQTVALNDFFGLFGYPSAIVDRHLFDSQNFIPVTIPEQWAGLVAERINETTPVNLAIISTFDEATRELSATVTAVYTEAIEAESHLLSIFLTEDHIVDVQLMPDNSKNEAYEHEHVVRDMFTNWGGLAYEPTNSENTGYEQGSTFIKTFSIVVDENWNIENLNVLACVHKDGSSSKEVLQAAEIHVVE